MAGSDTAGDAAAQAQVTRALGRLGLLHGDEEPRFTRLAGGVRFYPGSLYSSTVGIGIGLGYEFEGLLGRSSSLLLILRVATDDDSVPYLVTGVVCWYLLCWFGLPMWTRYRHTSR